MSLVVVKFGGSSLADNAKILRAAKIICSIKNDGNDVAAVVSANGKTTDELINEARKLSEYPSLRELDALLSIGEIRSAALMAMALCDLGCKAMSFNGAQAGFLTDNVYGNAKICRIEAAGIINCLNSGCVAVVAGFQGVSPGGDVTTLGRGGSDTSAVALAAALGAESCRIYTDVDGVYTADPHRVTGAHKLQYIDYDEMMELSTLGAKVLHNRCVELAKRYDVPVDVLDCTGSSRGTAVINRPVSEERTICGLAKDGEVAAVTVSGIEAGCSAAYKIISLLAKRNIAVDLIMQSPPENGRQMLSFTVAIGNLTAAKQAIEDAVSGTGWVVTISQSIAKVSVVGLGLQTHCTVAEEFLGALFKTGIEVRSISSSETKLTAVVDRRDADMAVNVIHDTFFGKNSAGFGL